MKTNGRSHGLVIWLLAGTLLLDQTSKQLARQAVPLSYLDGFVQIVHVQNTGAFLSLGADLRESLRFWVLTVAVAAFLAFALVSLLRPNKRSKAVTVGLTLLVAGGIGNLIDRIALGSVTDFLRLGVGPVRTGIFNVADVAIVAGVLAMLISSRSRTPVGKSR